MTRKNAFFEGWSWFKFNNLKLALGTNLKFCTREEKVLKLKVRKFWGLIPTFVEVKGEKLVGGAFLSSPPSWIGLINMVRILMMLTKMAALGLLIIKLFWKKYYDVIIFSHDVTKKFYQVNQIISWMSSKFGNSSLSLREVIITSIYKDLTKKTIFLTSGFGPSTVFLDWH